MSKNNKGSQSTGMMIVITGVIFITLAAVIAGFVLLQKNHESRVNAVATTATQATGTETTKSGAVTEDNELAEENTTEMETVIISESSQTDGDDSGVVYLIQGKNKGSNKYERVNRLSYTADVKYTEEALELLDRYGLRITRNEIFARHGRMFNDADIQDYFNKQSWYVAQTSSKDFDDSCLNDVERYNVQLILDYELKQGY